MSGSPVALATAAWAWEVDEDGPLLLAALDAAGVAAGPVRWDDPAVDWSAFDLVVVRSTWDYMPRLAEFLGWADRVASVTTLLNPPEVLGWNTDKRYLADLAAAGLPVVPSWFVAPDDGPDELDRALAAATAGGHDVVVKPTVSAGSKDTYRLIAPERDRARAAASELLAGGRDVLVQPYQPAVDDAGETGLVYFDGRFSHAFRKGPLLRPGAGAVPGLFALEEITPRQASPAERELADRVVDAVRERFGGDLLYCRVDLLPGPHGEPSVLELELAEPSFFLSTDVGAADRAAAAIAQAALCCERQGNP